MSVIPIHSALAAAVALPAPEPKPCEATVRDPVRAVPTPRPPRLSAAPKPSKPARSDIEKLDPKAQVSLHPKGCRCTFHSRGVPWGIPRNLGNSVPLMQGRRIVLYDIENQLGSPGASALEVARAFRFTRGVLSLTRDDYVIFGMSHFTADRCAFALPTNQAALVLRSGPSGADRALIEAVDLERLSRHYSSLVVVSNDYIFAQFAKRAKELGMTTWNVSSDLAKISEQTRAAYDGWTHLKLSTIRKNQRERSKALRETRAQTATVAPSGAHR